MERLRNIAAPVAVFAIPMALLAAAASVFGLICEVVGIVQQTPVQRGIDAHPVRVTATYTAYYAGASKWNDPTYTLSYLHEGEEFSTPLRSLPGNHSIGDELCAEIDAEQPENGRVCGTRGGLADAQSGLRTGGLILGPALLILGIPLLAPLASWLYNRVPAALRRTPARRPGNGKHRKPSRRGS